jgi:hypothetical protein
MSSYIVGSGLGQLKIVARGDCTSRRAVALNPSSFDEPPIFVQSQKSTFGQFLDSFQNLGLTGEMLESISNVDEMPKTLASYYLGQANRDALHCQEADLLILDSYADLNFSLWRAKQGGPRFWIHPKFLKNREAFLLDHDDLGQSTLQQSVDDAVLLIENIRETAPSLPVLFLNQQVDFYPKLSDRQSDYYQLGALVAARVPDVFYGGVVPKEELELADVGSCGPGNTLHFQGSTYKKMFETALSNGLNEALSRRRATNSVLEHTPNKSSQTEDPPATLRELGHAPCKWAEIVITEIIEPDLMLNVESCDDACRGLLGALPKGLENYFYLEHKTDQVTPPRFTPMFIDLETIQDFNSWLYSRPATYRHQFQKSERADFSFEPYNRKNHVPDIFEINTSKVDRSGGPIRATLTRSVEEMGGAATTLMPLDSLTCMHHWRQTLGVFNATEGYLQGDLDVGKKMVAYITVVRHGEFAIVTQIMGHGDYLAKGVVNFALQKFVEASLAEQWGKHSGLRFIMYGGVQNGGEGLYNFKRRSGFAPYIVSLNFQDGYEKASFDVQDKQSLLDPDPLPLSARARCIDIPGIGSPIWIQHHG